MKMNANSCIVITSDSNGTRYERYHLPETAAFVSSLRRDQGIYSWQVTLDANDIKRLHKAYEVYDEVASESAHDTTMSESDYDKILDLVDGARDELASAIAAYADIDERTACDMVLYNSGRIADLMAKVA